MQLAKGRAHEGQRTANLSSGVKLPDGNAVY